MGKYHCGLYIDLVRRGLTDYTILFSDLVCTYQLFFFNHRRRREQVWADLADGRQTRLALEAGAPEGPRVRVKYLGAARDRVGEGIGDHEGAAERADAHG